MAFDNTISFFLILIIGINFQGTHYASNHNRSITMWLLIDDNWYMGPKDFAEGKMQKTDTVSREHYKGLGKSTFIFYSSHTADSR